MTTSRDSDPFPPIVRVYFGPFRLLLSATFQFLTALIWFMFIGAEPSWIPLGLVGIGVVEILIAATWAHRR